MVLSAQVLQSEMQWELEQKRFGALIIATLSCYELWLWVNSKLEKSTQLVILSQTATNKMILENEKSVGKL